MDAEYKYRENDLTLLIVLNRTRLGATTRSALQTNGTLSVVAVESAKNLLRKTTASDQSPISDQSLLLYCCDSKMATETGQDLRTLRELLPSLKVVLLTEEITREHIELFDQYKLSGLAHASLNSEQLKHCLQLICAGVRFLPVETREKYKTRSTNVDEINLDELGVELTPRQQEVLRYVALGKSNKYIAAELSLCESTVKVHVHDLMKRLGATSRTHASYLVSRSASM